MNKMKFQIEGKPVEGIELIKQQQSEFSILKKDLNIHFTLRDELNVKWARLINNPEFEIITDKTKDGEFLIRSSSDGITLATLTSKELAEQIVELMNVAHREGAKQIIQILDK